MIRAGLALGLGLALSGCSDHDGAASGGPSAAPAGDRLAPLRRYEAERRAAADFAHLPTADRAMGPDPIALRALPAGGGDGPGRPRLVSALRGRDAVVLLDGALRELDRAAAPASPTGIAVTTAGEVLVGGEASPVIRRYAVSGASLVPAGEIPVAGAHGVRDIAFGPEGVVYALDERAGALRTLTLGPGGRGVASAAAEPVGAGPFRVARAGEYLVVACLLDHTLVVRRVAEDGRARPEGEARVQHDGPIWGFDAAPAGGALLIAAGGVEDHPLDRTGGSFGHIDSFVFLIRVTTGLDGAPAEVRRLAAVNVAELGVVTPKALRLEAGERGVTVTVTGYGGDRRAELAWGPGALERGAPPEVAARPLPPGTAALVPLGGGALALANPLLDAWLLEQDGEVTQAPVRDDAAPARDPEVRLGEALFFTTQMAPWNRTDGELSRFTCETCHFEGYVDGRTHHTGRGDVRATTKPLLGLFNNRPHFSRALDPDLATVAHNEFRVAGARSDHDPWFSLDARDAPWLAALAPGGDRFAPESLRRALMAFLMDFNHRPNPAVLGRLPGQGGAAAPPARFTDVERAGAEAFQVRCERCHAARLESDDPGSAVPFARWEELVLAREGAIVWGRDGYEQTGVVPYVHARGARVPSLRRLYKKHPYFTNGSAKSLREVLERTRSTGGAFWHDVPAPGAPGAPEPGAGLEALDERTIEAVLAFLDLL